MDVIIDSLLDNIAGISVTVLGLLAFMSKVTTTLKSTVTLIKDKAENTDVQALKKELDETKVTLTEILELQEVYAHFQSEYSNVLPEEFKDKYKDILNRYKG